MREPHGPELTNDGCEIAPSCFACPLPDCMVDPNTAQLASRGARRVQREVWSYLEPEWGVSEMVDALTLSTRDAVRRTGRSAWAVRAMRRSLLRNPAKMAGFPPGPAADAYNSQIWEVIGHAND